MVALVEQGGTFGRLEVQLDRVGAVVPRLGDEAGGGIDVAAGADGDEEGGLGDLGDLS